MREGTRAVHTFRNLLTLILGACLIFQQMALADQQLVLPGADLLAPDIEYTPKKQFNPDELIRIEATVTDNVGVAEVNLFYRSTGDPEYRRVKMAHKPNTDIYWAVLPNNAGPLVQYYLEAADQAGNTLLRGRSFDPLTLTIPASTVADQRTTVPPTIPEAKQPERTGISKWVWIGAGVLAVGALAALAGGGGGGGSDGTTPVSPASTNTGTVIVNAPVP